MAVSNVLDVIAAHIVSPDTQRNRCIKCKAILGPARCVLHVWPLIRKPGVHVHVEYLQESDGGRDGMPLKQRSFQSTIPDSQGQTIKCLLRDCYNNEYR